ncbi:hypothetical protein LOTGIDRAFT_174557 [Lottia gigantea]|uniref:Uncharacterized protein n=1 Tax=Lottia gigantea TaxID=225164 RepID=V4ATT4_LOTGI|nr:hypothetical protein LOTGIDRAFT_174557 [Lottia gigantea]ESO97171.1 hypothetical protein LOTGIDRAFT_174557 [Lottia gigantea]
MKPEILVMKIIEAVETDSPTVITFNGKKINITKKLIDKYKYCKVRDDIDLERIDTNVKKGGFIFSLPLIFAGLTAVGAIAGGAAAGVRTANEDKAAKVTAAEERGSSGSGKTHLTFNMLTTPNLLDFESLYIYTTIPEQSYYQFLKALEYLPKKDVQEVEIKDIIDNYIEAKNPTDIKVFLTKNVNDLDLSNIDSNRKNLILFDNCVAQRNQAVQQEFFTKGRHHNCHCIYQSQSFYGMDSMLIRKNANCFLF